MHIGDGSPWVAVLAGIPFALLMLSLTCYLLARLGHGLAAAVGLASVPSGTLRGAFGLLRSLLRDAIAAALFGLLSALSLAVALFGLINYAPAIGLAHPYLTRLVDWKVDAPTTQRELVRGLKAGKRSLVELALAIGGDVSNRGSTSLLPMTADPALRALLIAHGAPVDGLPEQTPPLRTAVDEHDRVLFEQLLRSGARRGIEPTPDDRPPLEWMAEVGYGVEWLDTAIAAGVDLASAGYGGASLYDALSLTAPGGDWWQRLKAAGLHHRLPLDVQQAVAADHPGIRHVLAWLQAQGNDVEVRANPDWELAQARPADSTWIDVPHTEPQVLDVYGTHADLLVRVRGIGYGSDPVTVVVRVVMLVAESGGLPAESDPSMPSAAQLGQDWRVAGIWTDARAD